MATVVVVIGILTAVAVPVFSQNDDLTAAAAARLVMADLLYAQSQAIATQQSQFVSFNRTGTGGYSLYSGQPLTTVITNPTTLKPYMVAFGSGAMADVAFSGMTLDDQNNTVLGFDPLGVPYVCRTSTTPVALAATGQLVLTCGSTKVTLSIEPDTGDIGCSSGRDSGSSGSDGDGDNSGSGSNNSGSGNSNSGSGNNVNQTGQH